MEELNYKALLIGNGVFQKDPHNLPELKGPRNDLCILEKTLSHPQVGLFSPENITTLLDQPRSAVTENIEEFFNASGRDDQLLFYYSGHGLLDMFNHLYLCVADTKTTSLISTAISDEVINSMIRQATSCRIVIILDCCHSGRFKGSIPDNLRGEGRFVLTSTRTRELAEDASDLDTPSVFTRYLTEALLSGEVDTNRDGYVSVNEVYDFVLDRIVQETKQRPQRKFDDTVGEVALGRSVGQRKRPLGKKASTRKQRPKLNVSVTNIEIDDVELDEKLPNETIDVFNEGGGKLDWTVECEQDWVKLEKHAHYFVMCLSPQPGINRARVLVRDKASGGSKRIQVKVQVNKESRAPILSLTEQFIDFGEVSLNSQRPSRSLRIMNDGGGNLDPSISACDNWIEASIRGDILEVEVDTDRSGKRSGRIMLETNGGNVEIPVSVHVGEGPVLSVKPTALNFSKVPAGTKEKKSVEIRNSGKGEFNWDFKRTGDFFSVSRQKDNLSVSLNCKTPGDHNGAIIITSNGGEKTVPVHAEIDIPELPNIGGTWYAPGAIVEFSGSAGHYQYSDMNGMGIVVGQGVAQQTGNTLTMQGNHMILGPYSAVLTIKGNKMTGMASIQGQKAPLTLQRGSVAGGNNIWNMLGQFF